MDLLGYLSKFDYISTSSDSEIRMNCRACGDHKHHMYVHVRSGKWMCHRCGEHGSLYTLIAQLEGDADYRTIKQICQKFKTPEIPSSLSFHDIKEMLLSREKETSVETHKTIPWPKYYLRDACFSSVAMDYLKSRGFSKEDVQFYRLKTDRQEKYIVVPFFENGDLVYYQIRGINNSQKLNPEKGVALGKSCYLFNHDGAKQYEEVVVVEGWADAMTVGKNAVSIQGKILSKIQAKKLADMKANKYVIFFDADDSTAQHQVNSAKLLQGYTDKPVFMVNSYTQTDKDPNDLGRDRCRELIANHALKYGTTSKLALAVSSLFI